MHTNNIGFSLYKEKKIFKKAIEALEKNQKKINPNIPMTLQQAWFLLTIKIKIYESGSKTILKRGLLKKGPD